jgi:hypothetical protein
MPIYRYRCESCKYSHENGAKINCYKFVGECCVSDGSPKWIPPEPDTDGFNEEPYLPTVQVMPEEKPYMSFEGVF